MIGYVENVWDWLDQEEDGVLAIRHSSRPLLLSCEGYFSDYVQEAVIDSKTILLYLDKGYKDRYIHVQCYGPYWSLKCVANENIKVIINSPVDFVTLKGQPLSSTFNLSSNEKILFTTQPIRIDGFAFAINVHSQHLEKEYIFETQDITCCFGSQ